jgi:hypothetical protein
MVLVWLIWISRSQSKSALSRSRAKSDQLEPRDSCPISVYAARNNLGVQMFTRQYTRLTNARVGKGLILWRC